MKILLVTELPIDKSHGTGVMVERLFSEYSDNVLHLTPRGREGGPFQRVSVAKSALAESLARAWNAVATKTLPGLKRWVPPYRSRYLSKCLALFEPDIVIGIVYSDDGVNLLECAIDGAPCSPAILWFQDLQLTYSRGTRQLKRVCHKIKEIWTLNSSMSDWIRLTMSDPNVDTKIVVQPHWPIPIEYNFFHCAKPLNSTFKIIMLGNIWDSSIVPLIKQLWRDCHAQLPLLLPIRWICHDRGVKRLSEKGVEISPEIEWTGEVEPQDLHYQLSSADMALVPFSLSATGAYTQFSVPSKMGELAAAGLPMVVLAHSSSATAKYVLSYNIGYVLTELIPNWPETLLSIVRDVNARTNLSVNARKYAEIYLDENRYRSKIIDDIHMVIKKNLGEAFAD